MDGSGQRFPGSFTSEDTAIEVRNWISRAIETRERTVIKAIAAEEFKSHPNDFKNVQLKEHKDALRKLSMEYVRLQKQNAELKAIIRGS